MIPPFPGMDPYLEHPELWPDVHTRLIVALSNALGPLLRPRYYVRIEQRLYDAPPSELGIVAVGDVLVTGRQPEIRQPNGAAAAPRGGEPHEGGVAVLAVELPYTVPVRERFLEVRLTETHDVVTVIEVLSPTNKRSGEGRRQFEEKRARIAGTLTNLVEIDLLRGGSPLPVWQHGQPLPGDRTGDYRILVSRAHQRPHAVLYAATLRDSLPEVPVPLRAVEPEPLVSVRAALETVYEQGGYETLIDYRREPVPPLAAEDAAWADALLREQGLR